MPKYTVKQGDTLTAIALETGHSLADIKAANAGIDYNRLSIGQGIALPYSNQPAVNYDAFGTVISQPDSPEDYGVMQSSQASIVEDTYPTSRQEFAKKQYENKWTETFPRRMGFTPKEWKAYTTGIANVESRGSGDYKAVGDLDPQYLGRYQMGKEGREDATRIMKIVDKSFKEPTREEFLNDPELQEKMFSAYTRSNFIALTGNSTKWGKMTDREKKLHLARAQLGSGNISKAIETGVDYFDGNKKPSMKWYDEVRKQFDSLK